MNELYAVGVRVGFQMNSGGPQHWGGYTWSWIMNLLMSFDSKRLGFAKLLTR